MVRLSCLLAVALVACNGGSGGTATPGTSTEVGSGSGAASSAAMTGAPATTDAPAGSESSGSTSSPTADSTSAADSSETSSGGELTGVPFVYVGGYTSQIRVFSMDPSDGALTAVGDPVEAGASPSFLAVDPAHEHLFAVNETGRFEGQPTGAVASFSIDPTTGELTFVDRTSSEGRGPAHLSTDGSGQWLLVATYTEGNAAVIPIEAGGTLGAATSLQAHGVGAQSHMIRANPANDAVFVPNRALDTVAQYTFDATRGVLTPNAVPTVAASAGVGPRHLDFHPSLDRVYVINEDGDTMSTYALDPASGQLSELQSVSTLPKGADGGGNSCADVHVHPSGAFVYGSNRGDDSIVTYAVDPTDGTLTLVGHVATGGQTPRNFEVSPDGTLMLVANQGSDSIVAFSIDATSGLPTPTGASTTVPVPSFVGIVLLAGPA